MLLTACFYWEGPPEHTATNTYAEIFLLRKTHALKHGSTCVVVFTRDSNVFCASVCFGSLALYFGQNLLRHISGFHIKFH